MTSIRQSELFASQDWKVLYRAFSAINFNATDPGSINAALRDYLRVNYPEDFNDWIESSEFVAIIDLLAWLAGTLAFKIDINARENFLETATARESILRLARFLSYHPSRARAASGLVKIVEISSDDDVLDANGRSLANRPVLWNNADDSDWFENFTSVLNAALISTNPFGTPLKSGSVGNIPTQLYRTNSRNGDNDFGFTSKASGTSMDFQLCNADFDDGELFRERVPDPNAAFHLLYRNDGNSNGSAGTGFFCMFKQGRLQRENFFIDNPIENQLLNLTANNITEDDIWVQTLDGSGFVDTNWTKVPALFSENITFNSVALETRSIFTVLTRDDDKVTIKFSDGYFGSAPVGNIAVWHRVCNGDQYIIKPFDISRITRTLRYTNRRGVVRTLRIVFSNYEQVINAVAKETDTEVSRRAPAVYATQSRMVSGEDYNVFPLSSNLAIKLKAVNRVYSGHSRHIDLNDPTSTYQDTTVFSDDGALYRETANHYEEVPMSLNRSSAEIVFQNIVPMLKLTNVQNYVLGVQVDRALNTDNASYVGIPKGSWTQSSVARYSSTGYFSTANPLFTEGSTILFRLPSGETKWVGIAEITGTITVAPSDYSRGPVTLSEPIPTGSTMLALTPRYNAALSEDNVEAIQQRLTDGLPFTLWFNPLNQQWIVAEFSPLKSTSVLTGTPSAIKVASIESTGDIFWKLSARATRMVFESMRKVKWFSNSARVTDTKTGARKLDSVTVLGINPDMNRTDGRGLSTSFEFNTSQMYYYSNGTHEPRRMQVVFTDNDEDGSYDSPDAFYRIVSRDKSNSTLFWRLGTAFGAISYLPEYGVNVFDTEMLLKASTPANGKIGYALDTLRFFIADGASWVIQNDRAFKTATGRGPNVAAQWLSTKPKGAPLSFMWKHYAATNHRIDMAKSNIVDIFVLPAEYDFLTRNWIVDGADVDDLPEAPSELDLRLAFQNFEEFKMFTDDIVWRPVRYRYLFGNGAQDTNLRAKFKVIKLASSDVSDGEVKSRVIRAINEFFDVSRWDFGETFYFTELAAFVHQRLATIIGSFVIVPQSDDASFGDVFEATAQPDEIFISTAQVSDVEIITSNTSGNLRIR